MKHARVYEGVDLAVDVLDTTIGDDGWRHVEVLTRRLQDRTRRGGIEPLSEPPCEDAPREVVDHRVEIRFCAIE